MLVLGDGIDGAEPVLHGIVEVLLRRPALTHRRSTVLMATVFSLALPATSLFSAKIFDKAAKKQLATYLDDICQWILARDQASESGEIRSVASDPFFLQGNLARVLMAGSELTKNNARYLEEALRWCDRFVSQQQRVSTSLGNEAGYWANPATPEIIDLSGNSLAAVALARGYSYADGTRRKSYQQALERYSKFLLEGVKADSTKALPASPGWLATQGEASGAMGFGYAKGKVLLKPATSATAAGAAFFAQLYGIAGNKQYRDASLSAVDWILRNRRPNGEIPNLFEGDESQDAPFTMITLCAEAIQAASYLLGDSALQQRLGTELDNTVRQVMRVQGENGTWGEGQDRQGCSGIVTLLAWYYLSFKGDETIPQSLDKFWQYASNPVHSQSFGVLLNPVATGWMGLTTAEMIKPGITFKKV